LRLQQAVEDAASVTPEDEMCADERDEQAAVSISGAKKSKVSIAAKAAFLDASGQEGAITVKGSPSVTPVCAFACMKAA
jgi:hypothetical protein